MFEIIQLLLSAVIMASICLAFYILIDSIIKHYQDKKNQEITREIMMNHSK